MRAGERLRTRGAAAKRKAVPPLPTAPAPDYYLRGIALRIGSATAFACMAALLKRSSDHGVSTPEMIFWRNIWALLVVSIWLTIGPGWTAVRTRQPLAHLARSTLGLVSMLLTFGALALLPLGEATTLTYAAPMLATILSGLVLKEAIGARRWAAVAVGFVGVVLVARPGHGGALPLAGVAVGLAAAAGQSAVMITLRQMGRTERTAAIVFWFSTFGAVSGAVMLLFFGHRHDAVTLALLGVAGTLGGFGQLMMTASLRFASVSAVVPFDYLQIVWATLIGWIAFAASPTAPMLAGAALIAGSGIYTASRERKRGGEPAQTLAPPEA